MQYDEFFMILSHMLPHILAQLLATSLLTHGFPASWPQHRCRAVLDQSRTAVQPQTYTSFLHGC